MVDNYQEDSWTVFGDGKWTSTISLASVCALQSWSSWPAPASPSTWCWSPPSPPQPRHTACWWRWWCRCSCCTSGWTGSTPLMWTMPAGTMMICASDDLNLDNAFLQCALLWLLGSISRGVTNGASPPDIPLHQHHNDTIMWTTFGQNMIGYQRTCVCLWKSFFAEIFVFLFLTRKSSMPGCCNPLLRCWNYSSSGVLYLYILWENLIVILLAFKAINCLLPDLREFNCETQPPASIGWVALSSVFV